MVKVYTKEHIAQMRIKDSPYAGSARILGYDRLQCDWVEGIQKAQDAEKSRWKRRELGKTIAVIIGICFTLGLLGGALYGVTQHVLPKHTASAPANQVTSSPSPTPSTPSSSPSSKCTTVIGSYSVSTGICKDSETQNTGEVQKVLKILMSFIVLIFLGLGFLLVVTRL
jgi:hypothetical protein